MNYFVYYWHCITAHVNLIMTAFKTALLTFPGLGLAQLHAVLQQLWRSYSFFKVFFLLA